MNIETSEPPAVDQENPDRRRLEQPTVERDSLGRFFLGFIAVAAGIFLGVLLALFLGLTLGWVGC